MKRVNHIFIGQHFFTEHPHKQIDLNATKEYLVYDVKLEDNKYMYKSYDYPNQEFVSHYQWAFVLDTANNRFILDMIKHQQDIQIKSEAIIKTLRRKLT